MSHYFMTEKCFILHKERPSVPTIAIDSSSLDNDCFLLNSILTNPYNPNVLKDGPWMEGSKYFRKLLHTDQSHVFSQKVKLYKSLED